MKQTKEQEKKVHNFKAIEVETILGEKEAHDVSKLIGNTIYEATADIGMMDSAREIYHTGETEFSDDEAAYISGLIMGSAAITARLKVAIKSHLTPTT